MCALPTNERVPPGLERGLLVLQTLACYPEGLRYSELQSQLQISKTALTRVLQHLSNLQFITHSSIDHRYRSATQCERLSPAYTPQVAILEACQEKVEELVNQTGWSSAIVYWTGEQAVGLRRIKGHDSKIALQEPGHITQGIVDNPYHVFFLSQLQWRRLHRDRSSKLNHELNHAWYVKELKRLKQNGFTMANNGNRLRLAAPIYKNDHCIGAVLLGHHNPKAAFKKYGRQLARCCDCINAELN